MSEEPKIFGFSHQEWAALPEWLQTFIMESNERTANAAHEEHRSSLGLISQQSWKWAEFTLRMMITIEGGSLVAILAFLGVLAQSGTSLDLGPLLIALALIVAALSLAFMAAFAAYFTAAYYEAATERRETIFVRPWVVDTPESMRFWKIGGVVRIVGIGLAVGSLVAIIAGVVAFGTFMHRALGSSPAAIQAVSLVELAKATRQPEQQAHNPANSPLLQSSAVPAAAGEESGGAAP
jgi:hypothetical protein